MSIKSLTSKFVEYRKKHLELEHFDLSVNKNRDIELPLYKESNGLMNKDSSKEVVPPTWSTLVQFIEKDMERINQKVKILNEEHRKHMLPDIIPDQSKDDNQVELMTSQITQMFTKTKDRIKKIGQGELLNPQEKLMLKNIRSNLAQKLQVISEDFKNNQKDYLAVLKKRQATGRSILGKVYDEDEDDFSKINSGFDAHQKQVVNNTRKEVEERQRDIENIAKSIRELAELFQDLSTLVVDQGTILDRIDYNIEQADYNTKEAVKQLHQAAQSQATSRKCLCMFLLIILIFGMIITIIIKLSL
eukprot:TRINITY_DN3977_c0_g1_i1.p1 TRINITY_DN3977_c0_g1~~TRINITY_DN3977_c0_g1_i1.p1  ORF type:complete len:303 (+),score=54.08 TRINITY_DN3977_c0_g1_i1:29-937(+)